MGEKTDQWFSMQDAADLMGVSVSLVRKLIEKRELEASNVGTGKLKEWRISEREIAEFMERRSNLFVQTERTRRGRKRFGDVPQIV